MIKEIYDNAFNVILPKEYRKILGQYKMWTSSGINEVNITVNLASALIEALDDNEAFACYEVPITANQRIDGMAFSPKYNAIFYIESKKFKRTESMYSESFKEDLRRLTALDENNKNLNRNSIVHRLRFPKEELTEYIILIGDHWELGDSPNKVDKFFEEIKEKTSEVEFINKYSFKSIRTESENPETYMLLSALLKIKTNKK